MAVTADFLLSTEIECLTALEGPGAAEKPEHERAAAVARFLALLRCLAPSLPGPLGFFNGYGRVYVDNDHLEWATAECDSPYALALLVEQQQQMAATALARLAREGSHLVLANNNYDGVLHPATATWGTHENYLV